MREIINISIGQFGNQVGYKFWESIIQEHCIDPTGKYIGKDDIELERINVYFDERSNGRYLPRGIITDLEPTTADQITQQTYGQLFSPDNFVLGQNGCGNNWAKGHYTDGAEEIENLLDVVRKQTECSDSLQGFQMIHSLGGGTGSGMGTLLLSKLREEYPEKLVQLFSGLPSPKGGNPVVEPYNSTLSLHQLIENADMVYFLDNEALYDICFRTLKLSTPNYSDLNHIISQAMTSVTASLRFPCYEQEFPTLARLSESMIPFPRVHFFTITMAPLTTRNQQKHFPLTGPELMQQVFCPKNSLSALDMRHGRFLASIALFRGMVSYKEIALQRLNILNKSVSYFVEWIPDNFLISNCGVQQGKLKSSGHMICNTTAITEVLKRISEQYNAMFKRRAFLHWYYGEGMDEYEFIEAEANMLDLIYEYQLYQDYAVDDDEFDEEEYEV